MIDDEDFERVSQFRWYAQKRGRTFYAARHLDRDGCSTTQRLHTFVLNLPVGQEVAHLDGDGLNDQKINLLACSHQDNMRLGLRKSLTATGEYRGVTWDAQAQQYRARIWLKGRSIHIGFFNTTVAAAQARDCKARELGWPERGMNFPR